MNICFSAHARSQLVERNITEEQVAETILNPGQSPDLQGDLFVFQKLFIVELSNTCFAW